MSFVHGAGSQFVQQAKWAEPVMASARLVVIDFLVKAWVIPSRQIPLKKRKTRNLPGETDKRGVVWAISRPNQSKTGGFSFTPGFPCTIKFETVSPVRFFWVLGK